MRERRGSRGGTDGEGGRDGREGGKGGRELVESFTAIRCPVAFFLKLF